MKEKGNNMHAEAARRTAAKVAVYVLLGVRVESVEVLEMLIDDEIPSEYIQLIRIAGKIKFLLEKAIMIYSATIWAKGIHAAENERKDQSNLAEIIFNSMGGYSGYRDMEWLPKEIGFRAVMALLRKMPRTDPEKHYRKELTENRILFLIRQTVVLLNQSPVSNAVEAIEKALIDKFSLTEAELCRICSGSPGFDEIAEYGLIYAGEEFRRTT